MALGWQSPIAAEEVEAVNQEAEVRYAATAQGIAVGLCRAPPQMTVSRPYVATHSLQSAAGPLRGLGA